jgi:hypothetical protein
MNQAAMIETSPWTRNVGTPMLPVNSEREMKVRVYTFLYPGNGMSGFALFPFTASRSL